MKRLRKLGAFRSLSALLFTLLLLLAIGGGGTAVVAQDEEVGNVDVVLVIDTSGSMEGNDPDALRVPAAKLFVDLASPGDKIGLVTMAGQGATLALTPNLVTITDFASREALKATIEGARTTTSGGTFMGNALQAAFDLLDSSPANRQRFVLLLTDGIPDPISQVAVVDEAVARFATDSEWPIFPIALGAGADQPFLEAAIATPTEGLVFAAGSAAELVDLYLNIYEQLLDDRYIEQISIPPGELTSLVALTEEYRLSQLSFILHRAEGLPTVTELSTAVNGNLVTQADGGNIYHSEDSAYDLYTIFRGSNVDLDGEWFMSATGNEEPTLVTIMARSDLRARWLAPRSITPVDERAIRYIPADRPFYVQLGAIDNFGGRALDLAPAAEIPAQTGRWTTTNDVGDEWDFVANDGRYTAIIDSAMPPGLQTLRIEVPTFNDRPIHLFKSYQLEAIPLPTLTIEVGFDGEAFGLDDTLTGVIDFGDLGDVEIEGIEAIGLGVRDPDGRLTLLTPIPIAANMLPEALPILPTPTPVPTGTPDPEGSLVPQVILPNLGFGRPGDDEPQFGFSFKPPLSNGTYTFQVVASIRADDGDRLIPYTDFASTEFTVRIPGIDIESDGDAVLQAARVKSEVAVRITSTSERTETLNVTATSEGLQNLTVVPDTIEIAPSAVPITYSFEVFTDNMPGTDGFFALSFDSPDQTTAVRGNYQEWQVSVVSALRLTTEQIETEITSGEGGDVSVIITSDSPRDETLTISWEADSTLRNVEILPREIVVPGGEQTPFTLKIYSDAESGAAGQVMLTFRSANDRLLIENSTLFWQAEVRTPLLGRVALLCVIVLALVGAVAFAIVRYQRRL